MKQFHTIILLIFLGSSISCKAQWSTNPLVDNNLFAKVYEPMTFCSDGRGGAFFAWSQTFDGQNKYVMMNRIDSAGHLQYGDSGIVLRHFGVSGGQPGNPNICIDGANGCYIVYTHSGLQKQPLLCHHIGAGGNQLWADTGLRVVDNYADQFYTTQPELTNAGSNGVMIAFVVNGGPDGGGLDAQRLSFTGARQWGNNGHRIQSGSDLRDPHLIGDGNGGFGVAWTDVSYEHGGFTKSLRFACFDGNGITRMPVGSLNIDNNVQIGAYARPILTHNKDFIILMQKLSINYKTITAMKIHPDGSLAWGGHAVSVRDTIGEVRYVHGISDGGEGVYVTWVDGRKVGIGYGQYMQHLRADSSKAWSPQGVAIDTSSLAGYGSLATDINGRFKIFWQDDVARQVRMQLSDSTGHLLIPGTGALITDGTPGRDLFYWSSVIPSVNNHAIVFLKGGNGKSFAKYAPLGSESPLPVHFISFTVTSLSGLNQLSWSADNEENIGDYSIERTADGVNFTGIGHTDPFNTPGVHTYTFDDTNAVGPQTWYRIKETDIDGNIHYSSVVSVQATQQMSFFIGPNPAQGQFTIHADQPFTNEGLLLVTDAGGRVVAQVKLPVSQSTLVVQTTGWPTGTYFCNLLFNGRRITRKIVVLP